MYNNLIINYKYTNACYNYKYKGEKMRRSIHLGISRAPQNCQNFFSFLSRSIVDSWVWYARRDLKSKYYSSQLDAVGKHRYFLNSIFRFVSREVRRSRRIAIVTMLAHRRKDDTGCCAHLVVLTTRKRDARPRGPAKQRITVHYGLIGIQQYALSIPDIRT